MGTDSSASGKPRPAKLVALVVAVLGLHVLLLQSAAHWSPSLGDRAQPLSFQSRMLEPARPAAIAATATVPDAPARALPAALSAPPPQATGLSAVTTALPAQESSGQETASPSAPTPPAPAASAPVAAVAPAEPASAPQPAVAESVSASPPAAPATPAPARMPAPETSAQAASSPSASPTRVAANTPPASVRLKYRVEANRFPFSLSSELNWQQDGQNYQARLEFSALGQSRVQTSRGLITPGGLAPVRFSDKYRSEVAAHFNREQGKISFSANTPDIPLLPGAQDRLSVLIQLAALLAGDRAAYPAGSSIAIQTIGPREADTWFFSVEAEEVLQLPGGDQAALKLLRKPRKEFDQRVELWLAPALGYLPVRVRITEANGDALDQKWLASEPLR